MRDTGVLSDGEPTRGAGGRGPSRAEGETGGSISAGALPDPEHSEPGGAGVRGRALSGGSRREGQGTQRWEPTRGARGEGRAERKERLGYSNPSRVRYQPQTRRNAS